MMWSKLQKQLYKIMDPTVNFQMHCSVFKTKSAWNAGQKAGISKKKESIPHYWITVNNETVPDGSGALKLTRKDRQNSNMSLGSGNDMACTVTFNASQSNNIYGSSTTVQPPALQLIPQIKF